jgi:tetratricopeptide (TPR) repeat protein
MTGIFQDLSPAGAMLLYVPLYVPLYVYLPSQAATEPGYFRRFTISLPLLRGLQCRNRYRREEHTMHDYFACLGIGLGATDVDVQRAFQRAVLLLQLPPSDPRALQGRRLLDEFVTPAHATLRHAPVRDRYLDAFRQHILVGAGPAPVLVPGLEILERASSRPDLDGLYGCHVAACSRDLFADPPGYEDRLLRLQQMNVAYILLAARLGATAPPPRPAPSPPPPQHPPSAEKSLPRGGSVDYRERLDHQLGVVEVLLQGGKVGKALRLLQSIQKVLPDHLLRYHRLLGRCYQAMSLNREAGEQFRKVLDLDPECRETRERLRQLQLAVSTPATPPPPNRLKQVIRWLNQPL